MPSGGRQIRFGDKCKDCGTTLDELNTIFKGVYLQSRCKQCHLIHSDSMPSRSKEARKEQYVQWRWGLTILEYKQKSDAQGNVCAICKKVCKTGRELAVDHNHTTNKIRDLLCYSCNTTLGLVEENVDVLDAMIQYIQKHQEKIG